MPELKILGDSPTTEDGLGFDSYVAILLDAIRNFDAESSLTIGIHGSWGSGKTSLMRMLEKRFEDDKAVKTIWFNAWAHGEGESIGLALLYRVLTELQNEEGNKEKVGNVLANVGKLLVDAGLRKTTGITLEEAQELFKDSIEIKSTLRDDFETAIAESLQNKRLVVFIDDLDRCLPEKTIEIFEVIKLFLDVSKCVFVIGVAREMIERGIEVRYKTNGKSPISGKDYIEKIIQVPFILPPIREKDMIRFIENLGISKEERGYAEIVARGTECNPRRVKTFLNTLRIRQEIAEQTGEGIKLSAKLFVIEYTFPDFYKDIVKYWEQDFLCTLERLAKGDTDDELSKEMEGSETLQTYHEIEDLKSLLKDEPFFCGVDIEPYIYLSGTKPTEEVVLDELLGDDSVKWEHAANKIKKMPDSDKLQYVNLLISKLEGGTESERRRAAIALGRISNPQAVDPLIEALKSKDEDQALRLLATKALGKIGDESAIEPLIEKLKDENAELRVVAAEALGVIGNAKGVEPLTGVLKDKDTYVRVNAAIALGRIGDPQAVDSLIGVLKDESEYEIVRVEAATALGKIGDTQAVAPLEEACKGDTKLLRVIAKKTMSEILEKQEAHNVKEAK